jgi:hypothetical protein
MHHYKHYNPPESPFHKGGIKGGLKSEFLLPSDASAMRIAEAKASSPLWGRGQG